LAELALYPFDFPDWVPQPGLRFLAMDVGVPDVFERRTADLWGIQAGRGADRIADRR
jgi:hypothetical protein